MAARSRRRLFRRLVYGEHWLGRSEHGTLVSVPRIDARALRAFHRKNWCGRRTVLAFCGDVEPRLIARTLDRLLRDWRPGTVLPPAVLDSVLTVRLGLLDGEPVALGNAVVAHGIVNLCLGATLPQARRRGVWEALVWARVGSAPDLPSVAYTSDYSRPGFLRMGFLVVSRFTLWSRPPR